MILLEIIFDIIGNIYIRMDPIDDSDNRYNDIFYIMGFGDPILLRKGYFNVIYNVKKKDSIIWDSTPSTNDIF
jgi:hypothetical protein